MRRLKTEQYNAKMPSYDPKLGKKSNIFFGEEKTDFSKKTNVVLSSTRVPPGGKCQIIFS